MLNVQDTAKELRILERICSAAFVVFFVVMCLLVFSFPWPLPFPKMLAVKGALFAYACVVVFGLVTLLVSSLRKSAENELCKAEYQHRQRI